MNGQIEYSDANENGTFGIGTQALYSCDTGYALVGESERVCFVEDALDTVGNWNPSAPTCQRTLDC